MPQYILIKIRFPDPYGPIFGLGKLLKTTVENFGMKDVHVSLTTEYVSEEDERMKFEGEEHEIGGVD